VLKNHLKVQLQEDSQVRIWPQQRRSVADSRCNKSNELLDQILHNTPKT